MQYTTVFLAASALFSGIAMSLPTAEAPGLEARANSTDAIADAKAAGIDINGAIPNDYTKHEGGVYHFEEGSKASKWVLAQIQAQATPEKRDGLDKREWANIGIGMWAQDWCTGQGIWADNVQYGYNNVGYTNFYSVGISYRGLRNNEQLDFSRLSGSDWCGNYRYSAARNTGTGCFNSQLINCFRLTHT